MQVSEDLGVHTSQLRDPPPTAGTKSRFHLVSITWMHLPARRIRMSGVVWKSRRWLVSAVRVGIELAYIALGQRRAASMRRFSCELAPRSVADRAAPLSASTTSPASDAQLYCELFRNGLGRRTGIRNEVSSIRANVLICRRREAQYFCGRVHSFGRNLPRREHQPVRSSGRGTSPNREKPTNSAGL